MIISGIADEAGSDIETQILAHKKLGWGAIELRLVNDKNASAALSDEEFNNVFDAIESSGFQVTGFASEIGNWSRSIRSDFSRDIQDLRIAVTRMNRLGAKYIRTMGWVCDGVKHNEWRDESIRRYKELVKIAEEGGVILANENCTGWTGLCPKNQCQLIEDVDSENLCVLFDIGNTVCYGYDPWEYYQGVKSLIRYVHIKDSLANPKGGESDLYTFPGEGHAKVREILTDLKASGYDGVVSIEPHVAAIVHDGSAKPSADEMYKSYLKYGRMATKLVESLE